jgi:ABC-2 type transport system permease protein
MTAFAAIVRTTLRQLVGGKRIFVLGALALLPALVTLVAGRGKTPSAAFREFHEAPIAILFLIVLPIVSLILGSAALGDERRDQTLSFLVLRPLRREVIAGAKLASAGITSWLVAGGGAGLAAMVLGLASGRWVLGPILLGTAISTIAYTSVFMVLGYLTGRAVLIGLVYVFIWEGGVTFAADSLANASLFRIGLTAHAALVPGSEPLLDDVLGALRPGAGGAVAKATVIAAVAMAATGLLLRRRDVT